MSLKIVLRTVCGCERIIEIPFKDYPPTFDVPYVRTDSWHVTAKDGDSCMTSLAQRRTFERTPVWGIYNYRVYLEKPTAGRKDTSP